MKLGLCNADLVLFNSIFMLIIVKPQQVVYIRAKTKALCVGENDANPVFFCSERLKCIGTIYIDEKEITTFTIL